MRAGLIEISKKYKLIFLLAALFLMEELGATAESCENFTSSLEGIKTFSWLNGDVPYRQKNFDNKNWLIDHLEIPFSKLWVSARALTEVDTVQLSRREAEYYMNSKLIEKLGKREKYYLVRGIIYNTNGKIWSYWDGSQKHLYVVHGSFHFEKSDIKDFHVQPIIVPLSHEPKKVSVVLSDGSLSAYNRLCKE